MFSGLPEARRHLTSVTATADESQRTVSRTIVGRILAAKTEKVLAACRSNGTIFTLFLDTMIMLTLANDIYPGVSYRASRVAFDFRSRLPASLAGPEFKVMENRVGSCSQIERMEKYRRFVGRNRGPDKPGEKAKDTLDAKGIWELARSCKQ